MKILLINHYAGSLQHGMEYRPYYLAREWVKLGHEVTIIGASFSHLRQKNIEGARLKEEYIDGIRYLWLPTVAYQGNSVRRFRNMLEFVWQLYKHSAFFTELQPEVVIASSTYPLDVYPAHKLAQKTGARFVFELHDLWPLSPMELGGMSKYHPFIMLMQAAEDYWCRYVERVISILPNTEVYLKSRGLAEGKFTCVPNGIVLSDYAHCEQIPGQHQELMTQLHQAGKKIIGYTGAHGVANALKTLLAAAELLQEEQVAFVLVGQGQEKSNLQEFVRVRKITNVYFLSSVTKSAVPTLLKQMDFLYIGLQRQLLFQYGISPNKLMDYMMAEKPVIHSIEAGNDLVRASGCGISVAAENPEAVAEGISQLLKLSKAECEEMGRHGRDYVVRNHDYRVLAQKFLAAIK